AKAGFKRPLVEIIKEQTTHPPGFLAVLEVEILIAPFLETGIDLLTEGCAGLMSNLMPMAAVLFKPIIRGQVIAAAKPPHRFLAGFFRHEDAHVGMGGG